MFTIHRGSTTNLARPRLRQVRHNVDLLRRRERTDDLANLDDELLHQARLICGVVRELGLQRDEGVDSLACELVVGTDDSCFSDTVVEDEGRLDLSCRQAVTGDVDDIYDNCQ